MMLKSNSLLSLLSLVALVTVTESAGWKNPFKIPDFLKFGRCATVTGHLPENFDLNKYQGLWFDIESVPNEYQNVKKCVTQKYIWADEKLQVQTRGLSIDDAKIQQVASMAIEMKTEPANETAHLTVTAEGVPAAPYQIIETDYHNYACVYSCMMFVGFKAEFSWVFGRAPVLAQEFIDKCNNKLTEMNVDPTQKTKILQADPEVCPYWEKLPKLLEDSKAQLSKHLGPDNLATGSSSSRTIDEMQAILAPNESSISETVVQEIIEEDMAPKVNTAPKSAVKTDSSTSSGSSSSSFSSSSGSSGSSISSSSSGSSGSSTSSHEDHEDNHEDKNASHMVSSTYLLILLTTVLLTAFMQ